MNDYEDFFFDEDDRKKDEVDRKVGVYSYDPTNVNKESVMFGGGTSQGEPVNSIQGGNSQDVLANTGQGAVQGTANTMQEAPQGEPVNTTITGEDDEEESVTDLGTRAGRRRERDNVAGWEDLMNGFTADEAKEAVQLSGKAMEENEVAPSSVNSIADSVGNSGANNSQGEPANTMQEVGSQGEPANTMQGGEGDDGGEEPVAETTGLGKGWNDEESQRWDDLQNYLKRLDEEENKTRKRNAWWELMTRGLVGSANLYGTTQGAPALDLSGSKDAFSESDAYARLKDKKAETKNLVMKQIENMEKQREAERKLNDSERNYQLKVQNLENQKLKLEMAKDKAADEKTKSEYDIQIKEIEAKIKQATLDNLATKQELENDLLRARRISALRPKSSGGRSGGGKSGSGSKGTYLEIGDKNYTIPTGRKDWFVQQCKKAKIHGDSYSKIINWISEHPNDPKVKTLQGLLGIK